MLDHMGTLPRPLGTEGEREREGGRGRRGEKEREREGGGRRRGRERGKGEGGRDDSG